MWFFNSFGDSSFASSSNIEFKLCIDSIKALKVAGIPLAPNSIIALPKTNGRMFSHHCIRCVNQRTVIPWHFFISHGWNGKWDQFTGLTNTQLLLNQKFYRFSFIVRPPYFPAGRQVFKYCFYCINFQCQIGNNAFQPCIFILEIIHADYIAYFHTTIICLPIVK